MIITHKLKMNLEETDVTQRLEMPMGDVSTRNIDMLLYSRQSPWKIPGNVTVLIQYRKPDGTKGEYDTMPDGSAAWFVADNVLTVAVAPQVLTAAGDVALYASIYLEEKVLHTFAVEICVKAPFGVVRTGKSEDYYYVTSVLRGPIMAQAGQILTVGEVDASGRVTQVEAMDTADLVREKSEAVLHTPQKLTDTQKSQARTNINAASKEMADYLAGRLADGALTLPDQKSGENHILYTHQGKLGLSIRGEQNRNATVLTNEDEARLLNEAGVGKVLYTQQALTDAQKFQARSNIGAAGKNQADYNSARLANGSLVLEDQRTGDNHILHSEAGKLKMQSQNTLVTFLTNEDESRFVEQFAPGGYGWGEAKAAAMPGGDANNALETGLYRAGKAVNTPDDCVLVFTQAVSTGYAYQTAYCADGKMAMRIFDHDFWSEWSYLNSAQGQGDAILYTQQNLTDAQKAQARENIGVANAVDIPAALPNPHKLTFTGAVNAEYDGSKEVEVNIPESGGEKPWKLIAEGTLLEDVQRLSISEDLDGNPLQITEYLRIEATINASSTATTNSNLRVYFNENYTLECWEYTNGLYAGAQVPISLLREYLDHWILPEATGRRNGAIHEVKNSQPYGNAPKTIESITFFSAKAETLIGAGTTYRIYTK